VSGATDIFDTEAEHYDAWFDTPDGRILFQNELAAIRLLWHNAFHPALEVGVGTGRFAAALGIVHGVDPAPGALRRAAARGIKVERARGEALPFSNSRFGGVLMIATLCFASDPAALFREAARALRPGGRLLVGDIPADSPWGELCLRKKSEGHRFYRNAQFFTVCELEGMLAREGFVVDACTSTLLKPPTEPPVAESPRHGLHVGAGFVCVMIRHAGAPRDGHSPASGS